MLDSAVENLKNMRYFTTKKGYMGMAPLEAQGGDLIAMFLGLNCGMVLRPVEEKYQVVGPCYIHGFMQGEALLGPYPDHWERVSRYDERTSQNWMSFVERKDGQVKVNIEDPRLDPVLPGEWRRVPHQDASCQTLYTDKDVDMFDWTTRHPGISPEVIRARGVDLKEFVLI